MSARGASSCPFHGTGIRVAINDLCTCAPIPGPEEAAATDDDKPTPADPTLPDGTRLRIYEHGGIDVLLDNGQWHTVASNPDCCRALAEIATKAADDAEKAERERRCSCARDGAGWLTKINPACGEHGDNRDGRTIMRKEEDRS